ncbi:hypothetical protein, partial [Phormidesmis priestleyi]
MRTDNEAVHTFFKAGPAGIPTQQAFSQSTRWDSLDRDREQGCIRSVENAYSTEGGLAVLYGNLAERGCIVKTAGVDDSIRVFAGRARVYESQDAAVKGILNDEGHCQLNRGCSKLSTIIPESAGALRLRGRIQPSDFSPILKALA